MSDVVLVDLNPLPMTLAFALINWCVENEYGMDRVNPLLEDMRKVRTNADPPVDWVIEVPAKIVTFYMLKHD